MQQGTPGGHHARLDHLRRKLAAAEELSAIKNVVGETTKLAAAVRDAGLAAECIALIARCEAKRARLRGGSRRRFNTCPTLVMRISDWQIDEQGCMSRTISAEDEVPAP